MNCYRKLTLFHQGTSNLLISSLPFCPFSEKKLRKKDCFLFVCLFVFPSGCFEVFQQKCDFNCTGSPDLLAMSLKIERHREDIEGGILKLKLTQNIFQIQYHLSKMLEQKVFQISDFFSRFLNICITPGWLSIPFLKI